MTATPGMVLRHPYQGIYYYADYNLANIEVKGHKYKLLLWREKESEANRLAEAHKTVHKEKHPADTLVKRIAFRKGGLFKEVPGKTTIYCYGVYVYNGE